MISRPNAAHSLVALVALTACAGRAAREEPTRFVRPVGAVTVDGFAVQVTVVASSRRLGVIRGGSREAVRLQGPGMVWTIVAETQAHTDGAQGPLGRILSCSFETDRLTVADVRAAVNALQFRAEVAPDGRAAVGFSAPNWPLPCPSPHGLYHGLYTRPGAAVRGAEFVRADSPTAALAALPATAAAWVAAALNAPRRYSPEAPDYPVLRGVPERPGGSTGLAASLPAWMFAVHTAEALPEALAYSLRTEAAARLPRTAARLVARVRDTSALQSLVYARLVPTAASRDDTATPDWARQLVNALTDLSAAPATLDAALAACAVPSTLPGCRPWRFAAWDALARRLDDPARRRRIADTAIALPAAFGSSADRSRLRSEALRTLHSLGDDAATLRAARTVLGGPDEDPMGPNLCERMSRDDTRDTCDDAKAVSAALLTGRCDDDTRAAATRALGAVRHYARIMGACVLARCVGDEATRAEIVRTGPTSNLNDRVLPMRPAWCAAADAAP